MGVKCKVCRKWMTPKFQFWKWFILFLFIPAIFWWFWKPLGYFLYALFIVLAVIGFFRRCPFCNTPALTFDEVLAKIGIEKPPEKYYLEKGVMKKKKRKN